MTCAERGSSSINAISPKNSPSPSTERMTSRPSSPMRTTLTWPLATTYSASPGSSSNRMTEFLGYARSRATSTTRCRSAAESWLKSGTFCSTSAADTRTLYAVSQPVSNEADVEALPPSSCASYISALRSVRQSGKDVCSETRNSPEIPAGDRPMRVWQHVRHALDDAHDSRGSLRQVSSLLHWQAEAPRHRGPRGALPPEVRNQGRSELIPWRPDSARRSRGRRRSPGSWPTPPPRGIQPN